jgi:sugar O-acyltransferase (sialic acid O-acetyltransferase NeuD family)
VETEPIVIFGAGEFAALAAEYFDFDSRYRVQSFAVDADRIAASSSRLRHEVISIEHALMKYPPGTYQAFVAIPATNMNTDRYEMCRRIENFGYRLVSYISSHAFVWRDVKVGKNSFVFENNVLQPFTAVGDRCILWSGNHVGHGSVIEDDVFLSSHVVISGGCRIGQFSFLGVNSTLNDGVKIGERTLVGADCHVVRDLEGGRVYVGSPAKAIPGRSSLDSGV